MLGRSHVAIAAFGWAAGTQLAGWRPGLAAAALALGTAAGSGAGPDIDEKGSNVARTHGPPSEAFAVAVAWTCAGHRGRTHWLATSVLLGAVVALAGQTWPAITGAVCAAVPCAWALRCSLPYRVHRAAWAPLLGVLGAVAVYRAGIGGPWLGAAVAFGWALHPILDVATTERRPGGNPTKGPGVALFAPVSMRKHGWGLLEFGGRGEITAAFLAAAGTGVLAAARLVEAAGALGVPLPRL